MRKKAITESEPVVALETILQNFFQKTLEVSLGEGLREGGGWRKADWFLAQSCQVCVVIENCFKA